MIHVVDSIMGSGKTSAALDYIKKHNYRFMYVTPYLDEVDKIAKECRRKKFCVPYEFYIKGKGKSKRNNLIKLIKNGSNIVTTHSLFETFDSEIAELYKSQGYILILDEVNEIMQEYQINEFDKKTFLDVYVTSDRPMPKWNSEYKNYKSGAFSKFKYMCDNNSLFIDSHDNLFWLFPPNVFKAFKHSIILTYMFDGQLLKYYFDLFKIKYNFWGVEQTDDHKYRFTRSLDKTTIPYRYDIRICQNKKMNLEGEKYYSLSHNWYTDKKNAKKIKNHLMNFYTNIVNAYDGEKIWSCYKDCKNELKGRGYTKAWTSYNLRATNDYMNCTKLAYVVNVFLPPQYKTFFSSYGIKVDEDKYALSVLVQWIWRSAIRKDKTVYLYLPSKRMRTLLQQWIEDNVDNFNENVLKDI